MTVIFHHEKRKDTSEKEQEGREAIEIENGKKRERGRDRYSRRNTSVKERKRVVLYKST